MPVRFLFACLAWICIAVRVVAAPYIPASDGKVLERLPFKPNDPVLREVARMRAALRSNPHNVDIAVGLARRYYELVGEEGDPRYLGYAQAALAPWWALPMPPIEVQLMRASLRQFRHDFDGALADLAQVLERDPHHAQARILRAVLHIVQARYVQARSDCEALAGAASELVTIGCMAMVDGLTGNAAPAYRTLSKALERHPHESPQQRLWAQIRLAELAQRMEQPQAAEHHFKQALALNIPDGFLLAAYADFLLDAKRAAEVVPLVRDRERSDTLMLRLMFAERALNLPTAKQREATLAARFAAAQLRGDTVHQQEEARFVLYVESDPKKALALARENWKVQREPRDARIFLEAALVAHDSGAAQPVLQWLKESRIEDRYLTSLGRQLQEGGK